jgi:methylenetetrahydrofolate reductase (NADPH)
MHITRSLRQGTKTPISIEIIPPRKDARHIDGLFATIEELAKYNLSFISVTSHAHELVIEHKDGHTIERVKRKRWDTNAICIAIQERFGITVAPHIICAGFTKDETEDALYNLHLLGVNNIIALQGDYQPPQIEQGAHQILVNNYASDLVSQVKAINQGMDIDGVEHELKTDFCMGVAGYPEKHFKAPDLATDIDYLKYKIDQGANFIITQMFFDNDKFFSFVDKVRAAGIKVPIIAGIKPLYRKVHVQKLVEIFHLSIPTTLATNINQAGDDEQAAQIGIEYCIKQCQDLVAGGVDGLHFYTMSVAHPVVDVLDALAT